VTVPGEQPVFAAPSVRRFARDVGVDIRMVEGSGPSGRISEEDVKRHARTRATRPAAPPSDAAERARPAAGPAPEAPPLPDFSQWGPVEREPLSRLRRTVARNMATSWEQIPHVTLHHWADVTAIEEMRQQYKDRARAAGGNLTLSVVMIKIAAAALRAHPKFNSSLDLASSELVLKRYYNVGVAVDTDRGLVVPVIRDVDEKNIIEISIELNRIAERARTNELTLEEMRGATFTVTNLGSLGTGHFSPIINYPEVAVLGLGRAERVPVWEEGQWKPRLRLPMSITFDHRVIDGADGARFMQWIADAVQKPLMLALEG
jgi:pyruvate dehydrogenase E2 component (dihydrolipoamide acetyltransferase)